MRFTLVRMALVVATLVGAAASGQLAHAQVADGESSVVPAAPIVEDASAGASSAPTEVTTTDSSISPARKEALPPSGCAFDEVNTARVRFQRAYDRKAFAEARDALAPVVERCAEAMGSLRAYRMRNELAVTLNQLRDPMGCLETLAPLIPLARQRDADILVGNPRFEGEELVKIAQTTRTNLRLCAGRSR